MENLTIDQLKQLVIFYKQKSADLEFETLKLQLAINALAEQKVEPVAKNKKSE